MITAEYDDEPLARGQVGLRAAVADQIASCRERSTSATDWRC